MSLDDRNGEGSNVKMVLWISDTTFADPQAELADDVRLGRYSVIGPDVRIEQDVTIGDHVWLGSDCRLGEGVRVGDHCVIGQRTIRRFGFGASPVIHVGRDVQLGRGVVVSGDSRNGSTRIGAECRIEGACRIGAGARLASGVFLGSGCDVGTQARIEANTHCGTGCRIRSGVRIGRNVVIGALSDVKLDVPPHVLAEGRGPVLRGVNVTGLQRIGVDPRGIQAMNEAFSAIVRKRIPVVEFAGRAGHMTQEVREFVAYFSKSAEPLTTNQREPGRMA